MNSRLMDIYIKGCDMRIKGLHKALSDKTIKFNLISTYDVDVSNNRITVSVMNKVMGYGCIYDSDYVSVDCLNTVALRELERELIKHAL